MQDDNNQAFDLLDLGAASVETKGAVDGTHDFIGLIMREGLSDD
ncbi:benenodin family lasso peptide [Sphingomonas sp. G-3-2-10]|nr:benenodin family lasso peptide [Sphingomonas sp. G-3-2-10]NML06727.1 benenodin family lasso peptide [Sphingomonas sp. G-3-2-10]